MDKVIARQEAAAVKVVTPAERGLEPQRTWVAAGVLDELAQRVRWSRENRCLFGQWRRLFPCTARGGRARLAA